MIQIRGTKLQIPFKDKVNSDIYCNFSAYYVLIGD